MVFIEQKIRDPLHNIIRFDKNQFENVVWELVNTAPFQRLRRVKQLGFSSMVYPGATHTRFAHSIGVFHTARMLMNIIQGHLVQTNEWQDTRANEALAASLLHDVGHGPFSHAFEDVGRRLNLKMAHHETVSKSLILDSEITPILQKMGSGFHQDVANVIDESETPTLYSAVVSSQFDADRLDYMRRDRLMCGTGHGAIDFDWLLSNIEIGSVPEGVDDTKVGEIKTFVLGPKALYAAESYVLGLFQLYPTVYFHKATRGVEKIFSELLCRVVVLCKDGSHSKAGLPKNHPIVQFSLDSDSLENALHLDDEVIFGALSQMSFASDKDIASLATRLRSRKLLKAYDIRKKIEQKLSKNGDDSTLVTDKVDAIYSILEPKISEWNKSNSSSVPRILLDKATRTPYKNFTESKGPLNQILIQSDADSLVDLRDLSELVRSIKPFKMNRAYFSRDDDEAEKFINNEIQALVKGTKS